MASERPSQPARPRKEFAVRDIYRRLAYLHGERLARDEDPVLHFREYWQPKYEAVLHHFIANGREMEVRRPHPESFGEEIVEKKPNAVGDFGALLHELNHAHEKSGAGTPLSKVDPRTLAVPDRLPDLGAPKTYAQRVTQDPTSRFLTKQALISELVENLCQAGVVEKYEWIARAPFSAAEDEGAFLPDAWRRQVAGALSDADHSHEERYVLKPPFFRALTHYFQKKERVNFRKGKTRHPFGYQGPDYNQAP
jgi:hypothetical protein